MEKKIFSALFLGAIVYGLISVYLFSDGSFAFSTPNWFDSNVAKTITLFVLSGLMALLTIYFGNRRNF